MADKGLKRATPDDDVPDSDTAHVDKKSKKEPQPGDHTHNMAPVDDAAAAGTDAKIAHPAGGSGAGTTTNTNPSADIVLVLPNLRRTVTRIDKETKQEGKYHVRKTYKNPTVSGKPFSSCNTNVKRRAWLRKFFLAYLKDTSVVMSFSTNGDLGWSQYTSDVKHIEQSFKDEFEPLVKYVQEGLGWVVKEKDVQEFGPTAVLEPLLKKARKEVAKAKKSGMAWF